MHNRISQFFDDDPNRTHEETLAFYAVALYYANDQSQSALHMTRVDLREARRQATPKHVRELAEHRFHCNVEAFVLFCQEHGKDPDWVLKYLFPGDSLQIVMGCVRDVVPDPDALLRKMEERGLEEGQSLVTVDSRLQRMRDHYATIKSLRTWRQQ